MSNPHTFLDSTSRLAGAVAARHSTSRRNQILLLLEAHGPLCLFELAELMGCGDNQISGRISELVFDGLIEPTGQRRLKPSTGCECDIYRLRPRTRP